MVETVGDKVTLFQPGDEVLYAGDITRAGSYAEYSLVGERIAGYKPRSLSDADGGRTAAYLSDRVGTAV